MCNLEFCDRLSLVLSWPALACSPLRLLPFSPAEASAGIVVGKDSPIKTRSSPQNSVLA
jgi:hypothetical protein